MEIAFKLQHVLARPFCEYLQSAACQFLLCVSGCWILGDAKLQVLTLRTNLLVKVGYVLGCGRCCLCGQKPSLRSRRGTRGARD